MPDQNVSTEKKFRIVKLHAENIRRLKAVDVEPPENGTIIIAGNNGQGKTSLLDSILLALAGGRRDYENIIRQGQDQAEVVIDMGEFVVRKTLIAGRQTLEIKTRFGQKVKKPQEFLDGILGDLSFDPLAFTRMHPQDRIDMLMGIAGLNDAVAKLDAKRETVFETRTGVNRSLRDAQGELRDMDVPAVDAPSTAIDMQTLVDEKNEKQQKIDENNAVRRNVDQAEGSVRYMIEKRQICADKVIADETVLDAAKAALVKADGNIDDAQIDVQRAKTISFSLLDPDMDDIDNRMAGASTHNETVAQVHAYSRAMNKVDEYQLESDRDTAEIKALDKEKAELLEDAAFPIPGLSFDGTDVILDGIHFDQLSSAETLRVSLAMAMQLNPTLRVIRITDGSLLDDASFKMVCDAAIEKDYQVWIEMVTPKDGATIIIEDGMVKERRK